MPPTQRIAAVLLAAGSSRRFGAENKLLADLGGKPIVRRSAETLAALGFGELICVTGPDADIVRSCLEGLGFRFVHNARHLEGMGGSVAAGINAVGPDAAGAMVCLGDMPRLPSSLLNELIAAFTDTACDRIVFPSLPNGSQRNPVLWPRRLFHELGELCGEQGAKTVLPAHRAESLAIPAAEEAFLDIDTVDDLRRQQDRELPPT